MHTSALNFSFIVTLVFISHLQTFGSTAPQIFTDVYTFCEYEIDGKKLVFPNKLWTIERRGFTIHFSLCKSLQAKCLGKTSSCLVYKNNQEFIDLGLDFSADNSVLKSLNGAKCDSDPSRNYSLSVSLQCSDATGSNPRLMLSEEEDDCTFEISMMSPDCQPRCTELIQNSYLLDIRKFPKNVDVISDSHNFSFTLCGSNNHCSQGISACEILNNGEVVPLATVESQHISYDMDKNELTARGRYKEGRVVREVQVLIKCNWQYDLFNATYKKVQKQGKKYWFELESSYGCVKLPQSCSITSIDHLNYNLEQLSRENGWRVSNVPQGDIVVNICGPLRQVTSVCADQYSQVCHNNNGEYINRGSILSSLKAYDDVIRAVFVSGSTCRENLQFLYSTEIQFKCSQIENGPVFKEYRGCTMSLLWETPHACPIDYYTGSNCYMNDRISNRNLQQLHTQNDRIFPLSYDNKTTLIYNFCGPIHTTCDNFTNVSFCLKTEQGETVIGWENNELISEDGHLRMELFGTRCSGGSKAEVTVSYVCTHENPPPSLHIDVIRDNCKYNVTVFTRFACVSQSNFSDCVFRNGNEIYNLSSLSYKQKNHVIQGDGVEYIFNLCGPIISGPTALCRGDTMFCLRNMTEVNVKKQYTSLGGKAVPSFRNKSLIIEAQMGSFCREQGHYKSVITFECSEEESSPTFVSKDICAYNFKWSTPVACPIERNCVINSTTTDTSLDLTHLQTKIVKFNTDNATNHYEFHLCQDVYTKISNGKKTTGSLKRSFVTSNTDSLLVLDLEKNCDKNNSIGKVRFNMQCSEKIYDYFEERSFENCILDVTLYTNVVCLRKDENKITTKKTEDVTTISQKFLEKDSFENTKISTEKRNIPQNNCSPIEGKSGNKFNLQEIPSDKLFFRDTSFTLNVLQPSENCNAFFCKNNVPFISGMCPRVFSNYSSNLIKLEYSSSLRSCDSKKFYNLQILLKCNDTKSGMKIMKDELCETVMAFNIPAVCTLLEEKTADSISTTTVIASSVTTVFVVIFIAVLIFFTRRRWPYTRYVPFFGEKSKTPIYIRNCRV